VAIHLSGILPLRRRASSPFPTLDLAPGGVYRAGWFASAIGGSALTSPYTLAGSVTLYAQWIPPVPVTVKVSGAQTYGGSPSFTYTTTPSGVRVASLTCATVGTSTPINSSLGVGNYTILGSSCSGSTSANYTLNFTGVTNGFVDSMATQTVLFTSTAPTSAGE